MSEAARVDSIDAIRAFRAMLWKFQESATVALGDAESEVHRTLMWVEGEQQQFWTSQIRKRHDWVERCKEAVRMKKLFKDSTGRTQTAIDEEKALAKAMKALEIAHQKLTMTKQHARKLVKEYQNYKGAVQRFATAVSGDIPVAVAHLDALTGILDQYVSLDAATEGPAPSAGGSSAGGMVRAAGEEAKLASEPVELYPTDLSDFPQIMSPQVALVHADNVSGLVTHEDGLPFKVTGDVRPGDRFRIFDTVEAAAEYANKKIAEHRQMECAIYAESTHLLAVIRNKTEAAI